MITERLLQFLWQMQYFNKEDLLTEAGENLRIIHPGQHNSNQGPDFINARIKIQDTEWIGNVELHTLSSLWLQHGHHLDPNYSNVILHVVWEDDAMISGIPVLVLQHRIPKLILQRYEEWMRTPRPIPCSGLIGQTTDLVWKSWKERLLVERMIRKSSLVSGFLEENKGNWEETFWWLIARNFGIKVNEDAFEEMARTLPLNLLTRHKDQVIQLESMLMGQAGLLEKKFLEPYPRALQKNIGSTKRNTHSIHPPAGAFFENETWKFSHTSAGSIGDVAPPVKTPFYPGSGSPGG